MPFAWCISFLIEIIFFPCLFLPISCQLICFTLRLLWSLCMMLPMTLYLKNLFRSSNQVHSCNTRFSSAGNYYVNLSRTNVMRNSISRLGPNLWNSLNNNTRELPRKGFKPEVHNMLLSFLASEDIYIESPSIIQNLISTCPQWRLILRLFFNVSKLVVNDGGYFIYLFIYYYYFITCT